VEKKIEELRNLGPRCAYYLEEVGINTPEELRKIGYIDAYLSLKTRFPRNINRMMLYALYGALSAKDCMKLSASEKQHLEEEMQSRIAKAQRKEI